MTFIPIAAPRQCAGASDESERRQRRLQRHCLASFDLARPSRPSDHARREALFLAVQSARYEIAPRMNDLFAWEET